MGFFGSFFGTDQQKDLANANTKATGALATGYQGQKAAYNQAANSYNPYVNTGNQANTFYANALGLNGDAARQGAQNTITSDPLWSGKFALDSNNVLKAQNARGLNGSGAAALAGQRVLTEDYQNALGQYANLGQQGLQASGAQSGVYQGQGNNAMGYGATTAGNDINYGNALAQSRNIGINNILGTISAASGAYNAFANPGNTIARKATA